MKPVDRLKEIDRRHAQTRIDRDEGDYVVPAKALKIAFQDTGWLIDRVENLTDALEYIESKAGHVDKCKPRDFSICDAGCEWSEIARKALDFSQT